MNKNIILALTVLASTFSNSVFGQVSYTAQNLSALVGDNLNVYGINNSGQVVAVASAGHTWSNVLVINSANSVVKNFGSVPEIDWRVGAQSWLGGIGITNSGQIYGSAIGQLGANAFKSDTSENLQNLGALGGRTFVSYKISNSGQELIVTEDHGSYQHTTIAGVTDISLPPGYGPNIAGSESPRFPWRLVGLSQATTAA